MSDNFSPAVCEILDLFYDRDGSEPDWAAIKTRLFSATESSYTLTVDLLRALWSVYEDEAAFETLQYHLKVVSAAE